MDEQITLEEALELVTFSRNAKGIWAVKDVNGSVYGSVYGEVVGEVVGNIKGRDWDWIETPKEKLQRLLEEKGDQELLEAFNQLEDNND